MKCDFCYRECEIEPGRMGWCRSRINVDGHLEDLCYGAIVAAAADPVEKKPLFHFRPSTRTFSIAMEGCNFSCDFCQNHEISQNHSANGRVDRARVVENAIRLRCPSISFTYSEPIVWQDYMLSVADKAHESGLDCIMVTNGSFSGTSLERALSSIDAFNIDLKGDERFYSKICHASMAPVVSAIERICGNGSHLEVTTMLIEGIHDRMTIKRLGRILHSAGVQVWHLSRFFPSYMMYDRAATSENFLRSMIDEARESEIPFIYPGNSMIETVNRCPSCGHAIARPQNDGRCPNCKTKLYGRY